MNEASQNYLDSLKERGYITYDELGNQPGQKWVSHLNCSFTTHFPCPDRILDEEYILDEGYIAMCWGCMRAVDPEAMGRIRSSGRPVETPGTSCWWVLDFGGKNV
jgi:hypothetical protein